MSDVGRKPQGFQARTVALSEELWARIDAFQEAEHLSNRAEAVRVALSRFFDELDRQGRAPQPPDR
jgi:metal-responsive CopG/Arc/MetJ family transcriptional regulator